MGFCLFSSRRSMLRLMMLTPMPSRTYAVQDFFRNPDRGFFRLSDDGAALGFMEPASPQGGPARMNVFVQALQGSQAVGPARRLTHETERDIAQFLDRKSTRLNSSH